MQSIVTSNNNNSEKGGKFGQVQTDRIRMFNIRNQNFSHTLISKETFASVNWIKLFELLETDPEND